MQIQYVTSLLQGIAATRDWLLAHVPLTRSTAGYDLFLRIANEAPDGQPIALDALLAAMDHPAEAVLGQLAAMVAAGLLVRHAGGACQPSAQFLALVQRFGAQFDSLFILRQDLRDRQLLVVATDDTMRHFAAALYDRCYDLGWLYLHNFGAACFLMASLVARVAAGHGYRARVASCYVEIAHGERRYLLGAQGYAKPGQIDGHAVCIVEERMLVDFGLGNARRTYRSDFPWALACDFRPQQALLGGITTSSGETVLWKDDWQSPDSAAELARYAPHLDALVGKYQARFG